MGRPDGARSGSHARESSGGMTVVVSVDLVVREVLQRDLGAAGERVVGGDGEQPRKGCEPRTRDEISLALRGPGDHEVDPPPAQRLELLGHRELVDLRRAARVVRLERLDDVEQRGGRGGDDPDADRPGELGRRLLEHPGQAFVCGSQLGAEPDSGRRQLHPAARAVHEPLAELVLELAQALAHARLGDPEPLRGAAEVQLFGQRQEHADLAELHRLPHR